MFDKIVCVDRTKLNDWAVGKLQEFSRQKIFNYSDYPEEKQEVVNRIKDADVVFVSWKTKLTAEIIDQCPKLKYIGMCCSLYDDDSANVAVNHAKKKDIIVTGIRDYGDEGVVEFIMSQLVLLLHGIGGKQWRDSPVELAGKKVGIIGLGTTGQMLTTALLALNVEVFYFSRSRKKEWEQQGATYLPLQQLLREVAIITIHLPKNVRLLDHAAFRQFGEGKILVNTSLGMPFEEAAFKEWINRSSNFAIFDGDGKKEVPEEIQQYSNVITSEKSAGWSAETKERLSKKVLANFCSYIES